MDYFRRMRIPFQSSNYDMNNAMNSYQSTNNAGYYRTVDAWNESNPFQQYRICSGTSDKFKDENFQSFDADNQYSNGKRKREFCVDDDSHMSNQAKKRRSATLSVKNAIKTFTQSLYRQTNTGWNESNPFRKYPICSPTHDNYNDNYFNFQSFDAHNQYSNGKRRYEFYENDEIYVSDKAKIQRTATSSVKYAIKALSQYSHPMRKALDVLFETEISAEGWEKCVNHRFKYYTKIRGLCFSNTADSIENAKEKVAEEIMQYVRMKQEVISWPRLIISFQLEQSFADSIEIIVNKKLDELMHSNVQYKAHKVRCGIVMTDGLSIDHAKVVAIATGSKCLEDKANDKNGAILHDMHAEVLARRGFIRFLYGQLAAMADEENSIFQSNGNEIHLKENIKFHLYVNTIPCGDARVFSLKGCAKLKAAAKLGTLRTKIFGGTENLPETNVQRIRSMSCSDKIIRWNVLGLQGAALAKYIKPIYLESIVLGCSFVPIHLYRAIYGRLKDARTDLSAIDGYRLNNSKFDSTFVMEYINVASSKDYGICWSKGFDLEVLNTNTGLKTNGKTSQLSKVRFREMLKSIDSKMLNRFDSSGNDKYLMAKEIFYAALNKQKCGAWNNN